MRAAAALVAISGVTGCGNGEPARRTAPPPVAATRVVDAAPPMSDAAPPITAEVACAALGAAPFNPVLGLMPRKAPPLAGPGLDGAPLDLASWRGKVVLVSFQAPWDTLTKGELPTFAPLVEQAGADFQIVRVSSGDDAADAAEPATSLPTFFDRAQEPCSSLGKLTSSWGVRAVPESFLVDRAGNLRFYFINRRDWSSPDALACVRALLADDAPPITDDPRAISEAPHCFDWAPVTPLADGATFRVSGTIVAGRGMTGLKRGTHVFLAARAADDNGKAVGPPVAVARLTYDGKPLAFTLTEADAMLGSATAFPSRVMLLARYDQDADAMTRQPGDLTGELVVDVPATAVVLRLDRRLP